MKNMRKLIQRPNGIEGDDIAFQLELLGNSIDRLPPDIYFYPLVDHYNLHDDAWYKNSLEKSARSRITVAYDLVHLGDREADAYKKFLDDVLPNAVWLTANQNKQQIGAVMPYDFMWNRFKSYYTRSIPPDLSLHHYAGPGRYQIPLLDFDKTRLKKFMCLTGREWGYRVRLYELIQNYTAHGFISNRSRNIYLENNPIVGIFNPVPNNFYLDSYISIYVESNWSNLGLLHVTEKTFDPLIKGHAILPLANPGTIQHVQDLGFRMPPFIDYSFDQEPDVEKRLGMIIEQLENLLTLDLQKLWSEHRDIFLHNQRCVYDIDYDNRLLQLYGL